jgi:hypothetical protein
VSIDRDLERERRFLRAAAPFAPPFRADAAQRLEAGEMEYGNSWATREVANLLVDIAEECTDIGAWAALTDQALDQRTDLVPIELEAVHKALFDATKFASFAYARVLNTRRRLLEIESEERP